MPKSRPSWASGTNVRLKRVPGNLSGVGPAANAHSKQEHLDALDAALDVVTIRKVRVVTGAEVDSL